MALSIDLVQIDLDCVVSGLDENNDHYLDTDFNAPGCSDTPEYVPMYLPTDEFQCIYSNSIDLSD